MLPACRGPAHYTAGSSANPWALRSQSIAELYTSNAAGQVATYTNPEGNLTVYVRFLQTNPTATATWTLRIGPNGTSKLVKRGEFKSDAYIEEATGVRARLP